MQITEGARYVYPREGEWVTQRDHPAYQFWNSLFNDSDWGSLIHGRNGYEWQVNLMVIGIALGFWEVLFYDLEKVGNLDGEQWSAVSFLTEFI